MQCGEVSMERKKQAYHDYTKTITEERDLSWKDLVTLMSLEHTTRTRVLWDVVRALKRGSKAFLIPLVPKETADFWQILYKDDHPKAKERRSRDAGRSLAGLNPPHIDMITHNELHLAISRMANRKASGPDLLPNEVLKIWCSTPETMDALVNIMNLIRITGFSPELKKASTTLLHKTGPEQDPANYRPITLQPAFIRLFEKVIIKCWCTNIVLTLSHITAGDLCTLLKIVTFEFGGCFFMCF